jgi:hypothetical protein
MSVETNGPRSGAVASRIGGKRHWDSQIEWHVAVLLEVGRLRPRVQRVDTGTAQQD